MSNRPPPVPPAGRSTKGPGSAPGADQPADAPLKDDRAPPANLAEQDRQGNIKQNTTHQGHQQDR